MSGIKMEMDDDDDPDSDGIENDYDKCVFIHLHISYHFPCHDPKKRMNYCFSFFSFIF